MEDAEKFAPPESATKVDSSKSLAAHGEREDAPKFLINFATSELKLIKDVFCPNSTQPEFNFFIYDCQMRGLNPLKKEIHFVKRQVWDGKTQAYKDVAAHQVGIDGLRIIAERTSKYGGQDSVMYGDEIEFHGVKVPEFAQVSAYKRGIDRPFTAIAYFTEFAGVFKKNGKEYLGSMWAQMPRHMIAKCAEALALRKAFPDTLAGIYADEEMGQIENQKPEVKIIDGDENSKNSEPEKPQKSFEPKRPNISSPSF